MIQSTKRLPFTIVILGIVSFLTDLSSELIYPLLPLFLSRVLGTGAFALGVIEGVAECTAALVKVGSGIWTDRVRRRKPFLLMGYGLAGLTRPLIGLATGWPFVLGMRFLDRVGKGLRTSPRDALIADVTDPQQRGTGYGLHRAMDHAGAVVGPLVAAGLLMIEGVSIRHVFLLATIPAAVVIVILSIGVREPSTSGKKDYLSATFKAHWSDLGRNFQFLLLALLVFTLGNSTDAFLLLRLSEVGIPASAVAILWSLHHIVKMVSSYAGGCFSDRISRRRLILGGWTIYALIYLGFAVTNSPTMLIAVFLIYGLYFGLTEPAEKAWVADLVPPHLRGTAFGYYHGIIGLGALPASLIFGFLWHNWGVPVAFLTGAGLAGGASLLLLVFVR